MTVPRPDITRDSAPASADTAALTAARAAYGVGLRGSALITAVAIAGAESKFNPAAHCHDCFPGIKEDSRGLWQINVDAHPQYAAENLYDPDTNARAMLAVSSGGKSWRPWSTYTSGLYLSYWSQARDAAALVGGGDQGTAYSSQDAQAGLRAEIEAAVAAGTMTRAQADAAERNLPASAAGVAVPQGITGGAATGIASGLAHATLGIGEFLALLANPATWRRVAFVVLGLAGLVIGAFLLDRSLLNQVAGTAVTSAAGALAGSI